MLAVRKNENELRLNLKIRQHKLSKNKRENDNAPLSGNYLFCPFKIIHIEKRGF